MATSSQKRSAPTPGATRQKPAAAKRPADGKAIKPARAATPSAAKKTVAAKPKPAGAAEAAVPKARVKAQTKPAAKTAASKKATPAKAVAKAPAKKPTAKAAAKPAATASVSKKPQAKTATKTATKAASAAGKKAEKAPKVATANAPQVAPEKIQANATATPETTAKTKPLRMKISKAKERALMKEFGLDEAVLSEEETQTRRARLKELIKLGMTRGYLTHADINDHLPDRMVESETQEAVIALLSDMGVTVYEQTPDAETILLDNTTGSATTEEEADVEAEQILTNMDGELGRTTDPVRMYMREMGTVELLTREGEIEIAKRIEGGLMDMMAAISECPAVIAEVLVMAEEIRQDPEGWAEEAEAKMDDAPAPVGRAKKASSMHPDDAALFAAYFGRSPQ